MAQTMYTHMNKCVNNYKRMNKFFKKKISLIEHDVQNECLLILKIVIDRE
jgi:hypothetical protein